jgi:hypothetical protein
MYSTILFIVETSLSGFFGSGARQTSAVERWQGHVGVGDAARELDAIVEPELLRERDEVVPGVAVAEERRPARRRGRSRPVDVRERPQRVVDPVLRAHHAEVAHEVARPRLSSASGATARSG